MKKSLFALAALGAFATAAQAQSSVTLFGQFDASAQYLVNGGLASSASKYGGDAGTGNSSTNPASGAPNTGNAFVYYDSAVFSSQWGMRGDEDLGGGMKASFNAIGDANTNNAGNHIEGIFRRGLWVGVSGGMGELRLGTQSNPIVSANGALMPVAGNTVNSYRGQFSGGKDYHRNAFTYITPKIGGAQFTLQYAANNSIDSGTSDGTKMGAQAFYSAGPLEINAGYQKSTSMTTTGWDAQCGASVAYATSTTTSSAAATTPATTFTTATTVAGAAPTVGTGSTSMTCAAANYGGESSGYVLGAKYKVTPAIQVGLAWAHGEADNTTYNASVALANNTTAAVANVYNVNIFLAGVGYQAAPNLLLGANYIINTLDSKNYNLQARYSLSKRTMLYSQINMNVNGKGTNLAGVATGNPQVLGGQTNTSPSVQVQGMAGLPNTTQTAYGVGIVHMF